MVNVPLTSIGVKHEQSFSPKYLYITPTEGYKKPIICLHL